MSLPVLGVEVHIEDGHRIDIRSRRVVVERLELVLVIASSVSPGRPLHIPRTAIRVQQGSVNYSNLNTTSNLRFVSRREGGGDLLRIVRDWVPGGREQ